MWSRENLKQEAKSVLRTCQGQSILICLVVGLTSMNFEIKRSININNQQLTYDQLAALSHQLIDWTITILPTVTLIFIFSALFHIFVGYPVLVGSTHFFLSSRVRPSGVNLLGFAFGSGYYGNVCKTIFLKNLFVSLWSLLFVIPGIYKAYQYRMVPYLLAENPSMDYRRALSLSAAMMDGEKWEAFVLDLSFIGWYFLSVFTCMILALVYINPYQSHTNTGLYIALREKAINNGLVNPAELSAVVQ